MPTIKITDAVAEPITLAEAKLQAAIDGNELDALFTGLITAARQECEGICQRTFIETTYELVQDQFSDSLQLLYPRIMAVDSVSYVDVNGVTQLLNPADYTLDKDSEPGWLVPAYGKSWPDTFDQVNAVRVRYRAGYGPDATTVPYVIKAWIKLRVASLYECGNADSSMADKMLDTYRVWST